MGSPACFERVETIEMLANVDEVLRPSKRYRQVVQREG